MSNFNRKIFVFGGFNGDTRLDSIEEYDCERGVWRVLPVKLPFPLANTAAIRIDSEAIILMGGGFFNKDRGLVHV